MRKIVWLFGVLSGLIIGAGFFVNVGSSALNSGSSEFLRYALMIIVFGIALFASSRMLQARQFKGEINFSRSFIAGFYIVLIASVIYSIMWEVYFTQHGADYVANYLAEMKERLAASGLGQLEVESRYANQETIMSSYRDNFIVRFGLTMAEIFPIGIFLALLNAIYYSFVEKRSENHHS